MALTTQEQELLDWTTAQVTAAQVEIARIQAESAAAVAKQQELAGIYQIVVNKINYYLNQ